MNLKKIVMASFTAVAAMTLVACGSSATDTEDTSLSKIEEKGSLVVALSPEFAPF